MTGFCLVLQGKGLCAAGLDAEAASLGRAVDVAPGAVRIEGINPGKAAAAVEAARGTGLDAVVVPAGLRLSSFELFASDLDSTLSSVETLDAVAKNAGYGDNVARITEAAMRGEIKNYSESLERRIASIAGCPVKAFTDFGEVAPFNPGAEALVATARAAGLSFHIVTGGFDEVAEAAMRRLGADGFHCNRLEVREGLLTGRVAGPDENEGKIVDSAGKRHIVEGLCRSLGISPSQCIAAGDGWNDVDMLEFAGIGAAYHAKPKVRSMIPMQVSVMGLDSVINWFEDGPYWRKAAGF